MERKDWRRRYGYTAGELEANPAHMQARHELSIDAGRVGGTALDAGSLELDKWTDEGGSTCAAKRRGKGSRESDEG
jgi:hypothetical protein